MKVVFDLEVSPNYFLAGFKKLDDGKLLQIEVRGRDKGLSKEQRKSLRNVMKKYTLVGFNSLRYDMPMILKALEGDTCGNLFAMSHTVVSENLASWQTFNRFAIETDPAQFDHIDISEPSPAVFVSLKAYGSRMHSKRLQDLPYPYDKVLTSSEMDEVKRYNENDLDTTIDLYEAIKDRIDLRVEMSKEYVSDLRSKSDAQIAEAVIISELKKSGVTASRMQIPKLVKYTAPSCVGFETLKLQGLLNRIQTEAFKINPKNGSPVLPDWLKKFPLKIGETTYKVGVGGLHSQEKSLVVEPNEDELLRNIDVTSYYPSMILEFGFYPKRLTPRFLTVYKKIYDTRNDPDVGAKSMQKQLAKEIFDEGKFDDDPSYREVKIEEFNRAKAVNEGLKIVLNGSFGKLGSMYSKLYAPDLMLQVTITGQMMLLMLIEELESKGFSVKSSNTDGMEIICPKDRQAELEVIVFDWELRTGMQMEHGTYKGLYARDVNNYVAVYDGYTKAKGVYAEPTLSKNSEYPIVFTAIRKYLLDGTPMEDTINDCSDITQFITARAVKGGGEWYDGSKVKNSTEYEEYIADALRYYGGFGSGRGRKDTKLENRNIAHRDKQREALSPQYLGKQVRWYYSKEGHTIHYKSNHNKVPKSDGAKPMMDIPNSFPADLDYTRYMDLAKGHLKDLGVDYE